MSKRLRKLRNALGFTQEQFAEELGVSFATVNRYENGKRTPDAGFFQVLVDKYGVNLNWLFTGKEPMFLTYSYKDIEPELLEIIESLSPEHQKKLIEVLKELTNILCKEEKNGQ